MARSEKGIIKRRRGEIFKVVFKKPRPSSPFDIPGIKTNATTKDIIDAIQESRSRNARADQKSKGNEWTKKPL